MPRRRTLVLVGIGSAAGLFSGLFGVGGGTVIVPMLILLLGMDERRASGTSLAAIAVIASAGAIAQATYGTLRPLEGLLVGVPAIGGVLIGAALQQRIPSRGVSLILAGLLVVVAVVIVSGAEPDSGRGGSLDAANVLLAAALGVGAGVMAGLLGVGGGALFVPGLALLLGLGHVEAEATSLLAIVPVSLVGAWRQHRYGNLDLRGGLLLGVVALPGALVGVVVVNAVPAGAVQIGFAVLLVLIAAQLTRRSPTRSLRNRRAA